MRSQSTIHGNPRLNCEISEYADSACKITMLELLGNARGTGPLGVLTTINLNRSQSQDMDERLRPFRLTVKLSICYLDAGEAPDFEDAKNLFCSDAKPSRLWPVVSVRS